MNSTVTDTAKCQVCQKPVLVTAEDHARMAADYKRDFPGYPEPVLGNAVCGECYDTAMLIFKAQQAHN